MSLARSIAGCALALLAAGAWAGQAGASGEGTGENQVGENGIGEDRPGAGPGRPATGQVPMIGRDGPTQDACVGIGRVSSYDPRGDGTLAVRERPSRHARQQDVLQPAALVWLCDVEGDFQGIVYAAESYQELGDCRVGRPVAEPQPYDGPCATGWVEAHRLLLVTDR